MLVAMKVPWLSVVPLFLLAGSALAVSVTHNTTYDPAELLAKIFRPNITLDSRQRGYGLVKFEGEPDTNTYNRDPGSGQYSLLDKERDHGSGQYGLLDTERDQTPLRFEDDYDQNYNTNIDSNNQGNKPVKFEDSDDYLTSNSNGVTFQDDNNVNDEGNKKKRKRKRRRKPKNGVLPFRGRPDLGGGREQTAGYPAGYGVYAPSPGYAGMPPYRRPRRPRARPSLATEALSSITGALTSIARYDDLQCVPRLLCEAAGGGALANNGVLQSIAGIQPLLTLLSAYNGVSSSPLFVFGRAVFLGMTSPGSPAPCRYAYPACPSDPEQLIHYLNNHNGGFFRFFNAPQLPNQNLEQFYNQLTSQGYGLYQPQQNPAYGYPNDPSSGQHYGLYSNNQNPGQYYDQNTFQRPNTHERPSLYNNKNDGSNYAHDYNKYGSGNQIRFRDGDIQIQKRIQNKPQTSADYEVNNFENDDVKTKWQFPADQGQHFNNYNVRDIRTLKFPDKGPSNQDEKESIREGKRVYFSNQNYHQNYYNNQQHVIPNSNRFQTSTYTYNYGQNYHNDYTTKPTTYTNNNNYRDPPKYHNYNPSNYNDNQMYQKYQNPSTNNNANQYQQNYYNNRQNIYGNNQKYQPNTVFNNEEYVFDHKHNFYIRKENNNYSSSATKYDTNKYSNDGNNYYNANNNLKRAEDVGVSVVYVVRGNGDPNRPEVVKLRPGQRVH